MYKMYILFIYVMLLGTIFYKEEEALKNLRRYTLVNTIILNS